MFGQHPLALGFLLFASLWSFLCNGLETYRADSRTPDAIKSTKGFLPKGQSTIGAAAADTSLWNHVNGATTGFSKDADGYVSTSTSKSLAQTWVKTYLKGNGYVYVIHEAPNMIDCQATLGKYNPYPEEKELAAIGGIKWEQVVGWYKYTNRKPTLLMTPNPAYLESRYRKLKRSGAVPKLAAFPKDHDAWREDPWKPFAKCSNPKRSPRDFRRQTQSCVGKQSNQKFALDVMNTYRANCPQC